MEKIRKSLYAVVLVSEVSHLFCCILPTLASVMSLFAGAGLIPALMTPLHDILHRYEIPMIIFSAAVIAVGWFVYRLGIRTDCHSLGHDEVCCHKTTDRTRVALVISTVLFLINVSIYAGFHLDH